MGSSQREVVPARKQNLIEKLANGVENLGLNRLLITCFLK